MGDRGSGDWALGVRGAAGLGGWGSGGWGRKELPWEGDGGGPPADTCDSRDDCSGGGMLAAAWRGDCSDGKIAATDSQNDCSGARLAAAPLGVIVF